MRLHLSADDLLAAAFAGRAIARRITSVGVYQAAQDCGSSSAETESPQGVGRADVEKRMRSV